VRRALIGLSRRSPLILRAAAPRHVAVIRDPVKSNVEFWERRTSLGDPLLPFSPTPG
jgi:hypothetical protein